MRSKAVKQKFQKLRSFDVGMHRSDYVTASEPKLAALTGLFDRKHFVVEKAWMPEPAIHYNIKRSMLSILLLI